MERILYISQGKNPAAHIDNIQLMLDSGCKWIQLRIKDIDSKELLPYAKKAKAICDDHKALLSINDHPDIAKKVNAYGVHLGLKDMSVDEARQIAGSDMIIGGTANTATDIEQRVKEGVDYIGLGPLHYTKTKQHLSPILGHKGMRELTEFMKTQDYKIPVIAVGGITESDIPSLIRAGVYGVGISTILTESHFPEELFFKT